MNCKHCTVEGRTTKYYYCKLKEKAIDEYNCRDCMMRIADYPPGFEEVFGKGFKKN